MPLQELSAGQLARRDRFADGTIICGIHERPDGRVAIAYTRPSWRSRKVRVFDPEEPVMVWRPTPVPVAAVLS